MTPAQVAQLAKTPAYNREVGGDLPLDRWISYAVKVLRDAGIETYESCEGGRGHAFPEPTVRFFGPREAGLRAVAAAVESGLPVFALRRAWHVQDGEITGPNWEITFHPLSKLRARQLAAERDGTMGPRRTRAPERTAT